MEEKESTVSGSLGNSETDSPPPVSSVAPPPPPPLVMNMNMNINMGVDSMGVERSSNSGALIAATPIAGSGSGSGGDLFGKKKRGRPRKYDSEGNLRVQPQPFNRSGLLGAQITSPPPGFSLSPSSPPSSSDHMFSSSSKRGRGRPPGSGNWQLLASLGELFANTAGGDFTPHVLTVNTGEDVAGKILSLSQKGPRGICILSANGAVSNVTIRQPGSSGGILTYEGRFEILSLTGSFTIIESGGVKSRTGGLSVSLASPDGRVIGGGVAGLLLAASPIQIVVGSFMPYGYKIHKKKHHREHTIPALTPGAPNMSARPISQAKPDGEIIINAMSPAPEHSREGTEDNANGKLTPNIAIPTNACWSRADPISEQRPSPDINVSVASEEDVQGLF